jgi:hypothetical protein
VRLTVESVLLGEAHFSTLDRPAFIQSGCPREERTLSGERVERGFAAILAADVAGYSRLMGHDEAGSLTRLRARRRELSIQRLPSTGAHRYSKTTGDGILIEFPSIAGAVACAVAVQRGNGRAQRGNAGRAENRIPCRDQSRRRDPRGGRHPRRQCQCRGTVGGDFPRQAGSAHRPSVICPCAAFEACDGSANSILPRHIVPRSASVVSSGSSATLSALASSSSTRVPAGRVIPSTSTALSSVK